jgi:hypothetical protein
MVVFWLVIPYGFSDGLKMRVVCFSKTSVQTYKPTPQQNVNYQVSTAFQLNISHKSNNIIKIKFYLTCVYFLIVVLYFKLWYVTDNVSSFVFDEDLSVYYTSYMI